MSEIIGPLGIWKFPFLNKLIAPKYSIRDHKVTAGSPKYINYYKIKTTGIPTTDTWWNIRLAYDTVIKLAWYDKAGKLLRETTVSYPEGFNLTPLIPTAIRQDPNYGYSIYEQISPR